jgi:hypothetical protein
VRSFKHPFSCAADRLGNSKGVLWGDFKFIRKIVWGFFVKGLAIGTVWVLEEMEERVFAGHPRVLLIHHNIYLRILSLD